MKYLFIVEIEMKFKICAPNSSCHPSGHDHYYLTMGPFDICPMLRMNLIVLITPTFIGIVKSEWRIKLCWMESYIFLLIRQKYPRFGKLKRQFRDII